MHINLLIADITDSLILGLEGPQYGVGPHPAL